MVLFTPEQILAFPLKLPPTDNALTVTATGILDALLHPAALINVPA